MSRSLGRTVRMSLAYAYYDAVGCLRKTLVSLTSPTVAVGKRLRMVMGYQRSGTNALFKCLSSQAVVSLGETYRSDVYRKWLLRSEKELRLSFARIDKPILLKPISESYVRSMDDVIAEFHAYDLKIVFICRDPVNVYYSNLLHDPLQYGQDIRSFTSLWQQRLRRSICHERFLPSHVIYVRYEDLVSDGSLVDSVARYVDLPATNCLTKDLNAGYTRLSEGDIRFVKQETNDLVEALNALVDRSYAHLRTL